MTEIVVENVHPERLFQSHHEKIALHVEQLVQALRQDDEAAVRVAWDLFEPALQNHLAAEETLLFPTADHAHHAVVERLRADHARIRTAVTEMGQALDLHKLKLAAGEALLAALRAHTEREEKDLYPWAELNLVEATWTRVAEQLSRERLPTVRPAPPAPRGPRT